MHPGGLPPTAPTSESVASRRPVILVVDDDQTTCEVLRELLQDEGYAVAIATTGRAGLERIAAGGVDLVVLDLLLPDMDGTDLCREVRAREPAAGTPLPIIMLTAYLAPHGREESLAAGASDYLDKPFDASDLVERVRRWL
jgi:CheY-like chemotaxis protein